MSYIKQILDECYLQFQDILRPENYRELIERIIFLNKGNQPEYSPHTDIVENVRTAMDSDYRFVRLGINGKFGLREWYAHARQLILPGMAWDGKVTIHGNIEIARDAAIEAKQRQRYMLNKYNDGDIVHFSKILDGFIIEHHLKAFFQRLYGRYYIPPANEGIYDKPCFDDWIVKIDTTVFRFDAKKMGHERDSWVEKSRTNDMRFFVIGEISNGNIVIDGFTTSLQLKADAKSITRYFILSEDKLIPAKLLLVLMNHLIANDIRDLASQLEHDQYIAAK